jgi:hypothetical protein
MSDNLFLSQSCNIFRPSTALRIGKVVMTSNTLSLEQQRCPSFTFATPNLLSSMSAGRQWHHFGPCPLFHELLGTLAAEESQCLQDNSTMGNARMSLLDHLLDAGTVKTSRMLGFYEMLAVL